MIEENEDINLNADWFIDDLTDNLQCASTNKIEKARIQNCYPEGNGSINSIEKHEEVKPKITLKRKFPGPAGLFPLQGTSKVIKENENNKDSFDLSTQYLCSQPITGLFEKCTWSIMCTDLDSDNTSALINKYNIEWIKNNAPLHLIDTKIPFLAAIIKQIKNTTNSPTFILSDLTGDIEALISKELYEEYNEYLGINSVIVLKEFSILLISDCKYYINIMTDNLIRIYKDSEEEVKIVYIQNIPSENLERSVNKFVNHERQNKTLNDRISQKIQCNNMNRNFCSNSFNQSDHSNNSPNRNTLTIDNKLNEENLRLDHLYKKKQSSYELTNENANNVRNVPNKFNFKEILNTRPSKYNENIPSNTSQKIDKNIFEQSNDSLDLDLSIDEFQDEFVIPDCSSSNKGKYTKNCELFDNDNKIASLEKRKLKLDDFKFKTKMGENSNFKNSKNDIARNEKNKIDCTQISIISQNSENTDVLKEVFSDIDPETLFDDF